MYDFIAQLASVNPLKDILVPAIAAVSGSWFAMRKFKRERIWQEKYVAYQRVLESIEAIRYWGDEMSSGVHMLPTIDWFNGKDAKDFYAEAKREIAKQTLIGTILLSEEFVAELSALQTDLFRQTYQASEAMHMYGDERDAEVAFGDHASKIQSIADKYLPKLIELARRDVGGK
jgi:hypothetical protein